MECRVEIASSSKEHEAYAYKVVTISKWNEVIIDTLIQEGSMCKGAMQCNGMPGGDCSIKYALPEYRTFCEWLSKQCTHIKKARNKARQETSP